MKVNIASEYISYSEGAIKKYLQLILKQYFDQDVYDDFINAYMNVRYYNLYDKVSDRFEVNIVHYLKKAISSKKNDSTYKKKAKWMFSLFKYILYFDSVRECDSVRKLIKEINDFRVSELNLKEDDFEGKFYNILKDDLLAKKEFLNSFDDKNFNVAYVKVKRQIFDCNLKHNLKFSKLYSDYAIEKIWKSKDILEQRLLVLYPLVTVKILTDILKGNFDKVYLVNYSLDLKDKPKKKKRILNVIDNDVIKEKLALKVDYQDYINNKDEVYSLTRSGFQIALRLDETVNINEELLELLSIFSFVIINDDKLYKKLSNHYKILYIP